MRQTKCENGKCFFVSQDESPRSTSGDNLSQFLYLWPVVRSIELVMSEKFSEILIQRFGDEVFLSGSPLLTPEHNKQIEDANVELNGLQTSSARILPRLGFGFWRYLLSKRYESSLWAPHLQHVFSAQAPRSRKLIENRVREILVLRNRLAHHEPLASPDFNDLLHKSFELLEWLSLEEASILRNSKYLIFYTP